MHLWPTLRHNGEGICYPSAFIGRMHLDTHFEHFAFAVMLCLTVGFGYGLEWQIEFAE